MTEQYNRTYERLVNDPNDLVGLLAYALYKQSKRDWLTRYKQKDSSGPSLSEMQAYAEHFGDDDLRRFRDEAQTTLYEFAQTFLEDRLPSIKNDIVKAEITPLLADLEETVKSRTSFKSALEANLAASLIITGVTAILIVSVLWLPDLFGLVKQWAVSNRPTTGG